MSVSVDAPVGQWSGSVTHDGEVDEYTVTFAEDGAVSIVTAKSKGTGDWSTTGEGTFRFTIREVFNPEVGQHSPNGMRAAYIQIDIDAQLTGSTYTGTGKAVVHGPDDVVIYSTGAETTARKVAASQEAQVVA